MTQGVMDVVLDESLSVMPSSFGRCVFQIREHSVVGLALPWPPHILNAVESAKRTAEAKERGGVSGGGLINSNPSNASIFKEKEFKRLSARGKLYVGVVSICKRPDVHVPVVLMLAHVITQHRRYRSVVSFNLSVRLGMIRRRSVCGTTTTVRYQDRRGAST